jgi:hypothetical protein
MSLKEFGIRNDRPQFIAFVFDATDAHLQRIKDLVEGDAITFDSDAFQTLHDDSLILKHYKIEKSEIELGSLETAIVNRIIIRDI